MAVTILNNIYFLSSAFSSCEVEYTYTLTQKENTLLLIFDFPAPIFLSYFSVYQHLTMLSFSFLSCKTVELMFFVMYVKHDLKKGTHINCMLVDRYIKLPVVSVRECKLIS